MAQRPLVRLLFPVSALIGITAFGVLAASRFEPAPATVQFVFTSDAHYGLSRPAFRGGTNVDAARVNGALIAAVNGLPSQHFPEDEGLRAGESVGGLDFLAEGGDIANREETAGPAPIQAAADSWSQFVHDYVDGLHTTDASGMPTRVLIVPGNHDASNAVGFHREMSPATDASSLLAIYNLMVKPPQPLVASGFDYQRDRLFYTRDIGGVHFQFLQIWPDSAMRARMEADLAHLAPDTPVIVLTHDQPDVEAKHFINPNGAHDINPTDQFENLLADTFADGPTVELPSAVEQLQLEAFLVVHPNVTAYFHGNSNWHQAYEWNGPGHKARLHVFRVDSPMKGAVSATDETRLSFQVVTIDAAHRTMTVRECLWNAAGALTTAPAWGDSVTVTFRAPRTS